MKQNNFIHSFLFLLIKIVKLESQEAGKNPTVDSNIVSSLALSYSQASNSQERIQILSSVAGHFTNEELKEKLLYKTNSDKEVPCTDYEITQARLHSLLFGPGLKKPSSKGSLRQFYTPVEDTSFLLEFIHSSDCVEPSPYRTATCEGKHKS